MLGLAKQDAMLIQYVPLSLHFIGPGILLVVYLDQAVYVTFQCFAISL